MYLYYSRHLPSRDLHDRRIQRNRVRHGTTLDGRVRLETCVCGMRENKDVLTIGNLTVPSAIDPQSPVCFTSSYCSVRFVLPTLARLEEVGQGSAQYTCVSANRAAWLRISIYTVRGLYVTAFQTTQNNKPQVKTTKLSSRAIRNVLCPVVKSWLPARCILFC